MTIRDLIVELCARTPGGVTAKEMAVHFRRAASSMHDNVRALCDYGRLYRGMRAGQPVRFFATHQERDAWSGVVTARQQPALKPSRLVPIGDPMRSTSKVRRGPPVVLPGSAKGKSGMLNRPAGPPGDPGRVEVTKCPAFPEFGAAARIYVDPSKPRSDGFAALGIGRYIEE